MDYNVQPDSLCDNCKHEDKDPNEKPCNSCVHWVDGYLTAVNHENKYLDKFKK